jgi:hypothetical protein
MVSEGLALSLDEEADVLYVRKADCRLRSSKEAPSDSFLILNTDESGAVVGLQILFASELKQHWPQHPDRHLVPRELALALDNWILSS